MKTRKFLLVILVCMVSLLTCETDPLTGKTTMALVSDSELFAASFDEYNKFLSENTVITTGKDAEMVTRLGENIKTAAEKWYASIGQSHYLDNYKWEYNLVQDDQINAWCMPGGKIVVYTGILPVTQNEDALAAVMGHEVAHALLNHGKQRVSVNFLTQLGLAAVGLTAALAGADENTQAAFMATLGIGSTLAVALPFSRDNENEADEYGLYLMAIAGYDPEASVPFWQRMDKLSGGSIEFLSTHPSSKNRVSHLRKLIPAANRKAAKIHLDSLKESILRAKKVAAEINNR